MAYVAFNAAGAIFIYWLVRVPKKEKSSVATKTTPYEK
jgi:ABC-type multidrug transport system permease subunit